MQVGLPPSRTTTSTRSTTPTPPLPPPRQVLILGARGRLGYSCLQAFAQAGWRVLAHVRPGSSLANSGLNKSQRVSWIDTPLHTPEAIAQLVAEQGDIHIVINALAPQFSTRNWDKELGPLTQLSVDVALRTGALLINPLSVLPYGPQLPPVLYEGESFAPAAAPQVCHLRAQSEIQLQHAAQQHGLRLCMLRIGTLYGHRGWGWISTAVAKHLRQGRMDWLGPYNVATPWAYAPDVAQTIERIAQASHRLGASTSLHFAGHQRMGEHWHQAMQSTCHQRGWLAADGQLHKDYVKWWMWKPAGWFSPVIRALGQMEHIWRTPHQLDNTQLQQLIGPEPHTPWQDSMDRTLALLDEHDDLHGGLIRTHAGY